MTEQSSTPSATAFGLSEGALEGWKNNKVWSLALLQHFSLHLSQCFKQKEKFVRMLGVAFLFFHLSLLQSLCEAIFRHTLRLSSELKRGMPKQSSSGTHSSSDERAERKGLTRQRRDGFHFEANIRPLSLVVLHSPPSSTPQPALKHHVKHQVIEDIQMEHIRSVFFYVGKKLIKKMLTKKTFKWVINALTTKVNLRSVFALLSPLFSSVTSSKDSVLPLVSRPPPRWVSPWTKDKPPSALRCWNVVERPSLKLHQNFFFYNFPFLLNKHWFDY